MDNNKVIIEVNGQKLHLVLHKDKALWQERYGYIDECWAILFEELLDGTLEINEDIWYWYIDGRCYETTETI